ncbi:MAG: transcriptional regulator [Burkholderiales bacterium GWF1_66_17]|nr:MAG: transcriptional regulator [Burkholderiales bacterium GWE1_65_30]OGA93759.1 MAG: transcriptional regulator [Burkholderiales bacterium GWF1_66_17]
MIDKSGEGVRAVDRALDILLAFTPGDHQLSAGELLKRVDLSRPTLYRLLRTLEHKGFVLATGDPQRFQLGPSVAHLAHVWTSSLDLAALAQPMMRRLWEKTGETVALLVHQGAHRVCVAELPSAQPLSFKRGVGYSESVVLGASGRAILAFASHPERYLDGVDIGDSRAYLAGLAQIRQAGYAISRDELIQGAVAVAVPFFAGDTKVMGSLAVFGPSARVDTHRVGFFAELLLAEAKLLSEALGQH